MNRLKGKIAVVTGASKGIGTAITEHMAAEGASVVVNYASSKTGADTGVERINKNGGKAVAVQADDSKPEDILRLFAETKKAFGKLDIRVNAINPRLVESEGTHSAGFTNSDFRRETEAQTPLGRIGQPQDIAPAAVFLASDESAWVTGETLYISGGRR